MYHHVRCLPWPELQPGRNMHGIEAGQAVKSIKVTLRSYFYVGMRALVACMANDSTA
jgi:hypothetical protein